MEKSWKDECGIAGVFGHPEASNIAYLCLYALQHRGQESAGIVSSTGRNMYSHRSMGLVQDVFNEDILRKLPGHVAIGHVRYSTAGSSLLKNAQPFAIDSSRGRLAVAHNGNLVNARTLRDRLEDKGAIFQTSMDTEVIVHLMAQNGATKLIDKISQAANQILGAFSLVMMSDHQLAACRDPWGFRPLVLGRIDGAYIVASETCALDLVGAEYIREVEPGEVIIISEENGLESFRPVPKRDHCRCIFEQIYFARPDSQVFGQSVYDARIRLGQKLWEEHPVDADVVISVPDSGRVAAMGMAKASGIPYEEGLIRNHYVGRTFIEPSHAIRHFGVKVKLNAVRSVLEGKRVIVVDDSIVRGTTCQKIVTMLREMGGASEVHMRISSPPVTHPCFYGIDTPTKEELVYNVMEGSMEKVKDFIGSESLGYLSVSGMREAICGKDLGKGYCDACFTGDYPVEIVDDLKSKQLKLFIREVG
ncbi:MAG: amidophosphoribosyltransferase [bacterium]